MAAPGLPGLMPVIVQENWVQCENPNCNKWRKVPPGYEAKEDEPWYCYLNPDDRKATCSASEEVSRAGVRCASGGSSRVPHQLAHVTQQSRKV